MPNALQWTDEGLYVMDQYSDTVYVLDEEGAVLRTLGTQTENGSGITVGGGYLWTASNGTTDPTTRPSRPTDTQEPWLFKLDIGTGKLVERFPTPDGGGIHGIEWDDGLMWLTAFEPRALVLVDPKDLRVLKKFPSDLDILHGIALDGAGIWCAERNGKRIVKYNVESGEELDRITFPGDGPDPHGLAIKDGVLWYSDAGKPSGKPEIGKIIR